MSDMVFCSACNASIALSAGTMTVDGIKCTACVAEPPAMVSELMGPAGLLIAGIALALVLRSNNSTLIGLAFFGVGSRV